MHVSREVKLAVTAIAALIILIWGINFLKAKALFDKNNIFYSLYDRVDGLKISSSVIYRGYSVGQVNSIRFVGERFDKVLVEFSVDKGLEIPRNTVAAIQSADLMGSKAVNLVPGDAVEHAVSGDTLRSQLELGLVAQLNEKFEPLKRKAESIMASLDTVLVTIQGVFNEDADGANVRGSLKSMGRTLENVEQASASLRGLLQNESGRISGILENVGSIASNLEKSNGRISRSLDNVAALSDSLRAADLNRILGTLNGVLVQADSILTKVNRGKGSLGGAVNDDELYYNLTEMSGRLNRLLEEFRQNPKRFVNLSVFDFGGGGDRAGQPYAIAFMTSAKSLPLDHDIYRKHPDIQEFNKGGRYYYVSMFARNLKQAEKFLDQATKEYKDAFIVKID